MTREEIIRNLRYTMKKHENDKVDTFGTDISLMCKDILDYLEQEPKWIPVSDEDLPKEGESVIASTEYGVYPEARYTKEYGWEWPYEAGADYWREIGIDVIAWMPLPKSYKPQENEKEREESDGCWCNTCEYKHLESECLGCAEYDDNDNLIDLRNYKREESDGSSST